MKEYLKDYYKEGWDISNKNDEELQEIIRERWTKIGFLDGIEGLEKINALSNDFEACALHLMNTKNVPKAIEVVAFPTIRRIFGIKNDGVFSNYDEVKEFINDLTTIFPKFVKFFKTIYLEMNKAIDAEAEACACFSLYYVKKDNIIVNDYLASIEAKIKNGEKWWDMDN